MSSTISSVTHYFRPLSLEVEHSTCNGKVLCSIHKRVKNNYGLCRL